MPRTLFPRQGCRVSSQCWRWRRRQWDHRGGDTPPDHLWGGGGGMGGGGKEQVITLDATIRV